MFNRNKDVKDIRVVDMLVVKVNQHPSIAIRTAPAALAVERLSLLYPGTEHRRLLHA